jgi:hypothetical protein
MRSLSSVLLVVIALYCLPAHAQYPVTVAPQPVYGGYEMPAQVPYQPTMPGEYPTYPMTDAAAPVFIDPGAPPDVLMQPAPAMTEPLYPAQQPKTLRESLTPPDARNGFFQKAKFQAAWIPQFNDESLGWTDLRTEVVTALPFFTRENPIIITPSYELHFLKGPDFVDLPARLNDLALDLHVFRVYDNKWIADFAVTPGLYADDHSLDTSEAVRVNGRALGIYAPTLDWKWVLGVTYVDGAWAKIVPVAGVVYTPNDDVNYELVFPRPRVSWRLGSSPVPGRDEYWFYLLGEFANAAWAIEQSNGDPDTFAYRDWRLIMGLEHKVIGGVSSRVEFGYVFNRDIKVASVSGDEISIDDSILLRAGLSY